MTSPRRLPLGALIGLLLPAFAHAQIAHLGVMGDSLSDEYAEETYSYAKNWPMQLKQLRAVDCGPTAAEAGQPGGTWGEPRRTRYKYDWARSGADSTTLLSSGQHTGVASQAGTVSHAVLAIGANDFYPADLSGAYFNIYNNFWSQATINAYVAQRIANVTAAVDTVNASGITLVLVNYPDYGVAPAVWNNFLYSNATKRLRVTAVIKRVNDGLEAVARSRGLAYIDLLAFSTSMFGANGTPRQYLYVGNTQIQLWNSDTPTHTNPYAGFVDDGAHPHTTLHGAFANLMLTALNAVSGNWVAPLGESEILAVAGLPYGGSETVESQLGLYTDYVYNFACPADYYPDGFVDGIDSDRFNADFETGRERADFNGDGFVDGLDYDDFNNLFEAGC